MDTTFLDQTENLKYFTNRSKFEVRVTFSLNVLYINNDILKQYKFLVFQFRKSGD